LTELVDIFISINEEIIKMNQITVLNEVTYKPTAIPVVIPMVYDALFKLNSKLNEESMRKKKQETDVPLWEKYLLTVEEAAEYFGIGQKRIRRIISFDPTAAYLLTVGNRTQIKRVQFEKYIDSMSCV
jgi:excisionase family DNA binding protein